MKLIQIHPFILPKLVCSNMAKTKTKTVRTTRNLEKRLRLLYLLICPEPCLGMDALFLSFSSMAVGCGFSQLPLVPSLRPWPKRDIGFLPCCWEKVSVC